jgi:hypothetical protein
MTRTDLIITKILSDELSTQLLCCVNTVTYYVFSMRNVHIMFFENTPVKI